MIDLTGRAVVWEPPPDQQRITTIDLHTAGEPFRAILSGAPQSIAQLQPLSIPSHTLSPQQDWKSVV